MQDVRMYRVYQGGTYPQFITEERVSGLINIGNRLTTIEMDGDEVIVTVLPDTKVDRRFGFLILSNDY